MSIEIERKYLVSGEGWKTLADDGIVCRQGYLVSDRRKTVRIRLMGKKGFLTVKGRAAGISRMEFEYEIDFADAAYMMTLCEHALEKVRYHVLHGGVTWEVDVFSGDSEGLVLAEVELESEDQEVDLPEWIGEEVTDDPRYCNSCLARSPYRMWRR